MTTSTLVGSFVPDVVDILHNLCTIEQGRRLLERLALGLDQEQNNVDKLEKQPGTIHDVQLPLECFERDRVHKLIRRDADAHCQIHCCKATSPDAIGKNFDSI